MAAPDHAGESSAVRPTLAELRVPRAVRVTVEQVLARTDAFCLEHLDAEYASLCRRLTGRLARKRPSPLTRGDLGIWAAGVVHAVGSMNFLFDPSQTPHLDTERLAALLGVKKTTMANKARLIRDLLRLSQLDAELLRRAVLEELGILWWVELDGLLVDARMLPPELQAEARRRGLIPDLPAVEADGG